MYRRSLCHSQRSAGCVTFKSRQVDLLTQAFPGRTRLGVFWDQISGDQFAAAERQARSLGLDVQSLKLDHPPYDFDAAFQRLAEGSPQMLLVLFINLNTAKAIGVDVSTAIQLRATR